MTTETILSDEVIAEALVKNGTFLSEGELSGYDKDFARAIEQAVLQSPEIQRLKAIETAAGEVLSMPREDGYIVLTVHLDALRAAME